MKRLIIKFARFGTVICVILNAPALAEARYTPEAIQEYCLIEPEGHQLSGEEEEEALARAIAATLARHANQIALPS